MAKMYDGNGKQYRYDDETTIINSGIPVVYIESEESYESLTKEKKTKGVLTYYDGKKKFDCPIEYKLQGGYSVGYDKVNLNITFFENDSSTKRKISFNGWYPVNKIHAKANLYDYSMVRNSVATQIAKEFIGQNLPKGAFGYVDSYPVLLYYNNEYKGCYTWNLPQDENLFNFNDTEELACHNSAWRTQITTEWKEILLIGNIEDMQNQQMILIYFLVIS